MAGNSTGLYGSVSTTPSIASGNSTSLYNLSGTSFPVSNDISITGNIRAGGYISAAGNVLSGSNLSAVGNVTGAYIFGNGSQLTGLPATYSNANVATYLSSGTVTSNIITSANVTGAYFLGNGSQLTGITSSYGNANVVTLLSNFGSNTISTTGNISSGNLRTTGQVSATGNITGNYLLANIFYATGYSASKIYNGTSQANIPAANGNIVFAVGGTNVVTHASTGEYVTGQVSATGNVTGGNLITSGTFGNITGVNYVSAAYYVGDGGLLSNIATTYNDSNVSTLLAAFGSNTISSTGNITTTANIAGGYILGNGSQLTGLPASYSNANVATFLATGFGSNTISTTGNINAGNMISAGNVIVLGSLLSDDLTSAGNVTVYGDQVITGNLTVQGTTTTINSNVITTNDKTITVANNQTTGANVDGAGLDAGGGSNPIATWRYNDLTGSWQSNIGITPSANATQNLGGPVNYWNGVYAQTAQIAGNVSVVGNISGDYILGNGSQLTGLPAGYSNANVDSHLASFGSNTISTTGNITAGYFVGNGSLLTNLTGANISGTVANATYAVDAGHAVVSDSANSVSGSNVSGAVALATQANYANVANSVAGANVTGTVADASHATVADTANAVAGGNVTGQVANALVAGTVYTAAQPNITSVGTLTVVNTSGNVSAVGNISGSYILGNGSQLTGLPATYSNANVTSLMAAFGSNTISTTGTITGGNITGSNVISGGNISIVGGSIYSGGASNNTMTAVGNCVLSTVQYEFGTASAYLNGTPNTFIQCASTSNFVMGTGDFTVEMWIRPTANTVSGTLYDTGSPGSSYDVRPQILIGSGQLIYSGYGFTNQITGNVTITPNTWNMVAVARSGTDTKLFWNGTQVGSTFTDTQNYIDGGGNVRIGATTYDAIPAGLSAATYIDEVRVSKGIARYTANFTPPTSPFTTDSYTSLLLHCDGYTGQTLILDASSSNPITVQNNLIVNGSINTADYYYGNGAFLTGIVATSSYGNANVNTLLAGWGSNALSTTGNVTAGYVIGNGSLLTNITGANVTGTVANATYATSSGTATSATTAATVTTAAQPNITSVGILTVVNTSGNVSATGNIIGGNLIGIGSSITGINAFGNIAVSGQTTVGADNTTDTLTLEAGTNITITTDAANNKVTFASTASGGGDTLSPFLLMGG